MPTALTVPRLDIASATLDRLSVQSVTLGSQVNVARLHVQGSGPAPVADRPPTLTLGFDAQARWTGSVLLERFISVAPESPELRKWVKLGEGDLPGGAVAVTGGPLSLPLPALAAPRFEVSGAGISATLGSGGIEGVRLGSRATLALGPHRLTDISLGGLPLPLAGAAVGGATVEGLTAARATVGKWTIRNVSHGAGPDVAFGLHLDHLHLTNLATATLGAGALVIDRLDLPDLSLGELPGLNVKIGEFRVTVGLSLTLSLALTDVRFIGADVGLTLDELTLDGVDLSLSVAGIGIGGSAAGVELTGVAAPLATVAAEGP